MTNLNESNQVVKMVDQSISFVTPTKKTVLICANGFQTTDTHDAAPIRDYFVQNFQQDYPDCEVVPVLLFEPSDTKTHHKKIYEQRLSSAIEKYIDLGYDIMLMGYSFSGSLVSKMAYVYREHVSRVILVAPIYDTIMNNMIPGYLKYAKKFSQLQKKYGNKVSKAMGRQTVNGMFPLLVSIFLSILANRRYMRKITQETLVIRGLEDVMFTDHALKKVVSHLSAPHNVYLYPKTTHGCLKSVRLNGAVFEDILHFAFNTPFLLNTDSNIVVQEKKTSEKAVSLDADGEEIPTFGEIFMELDPDCNNDAIAREDEI